MPTRSINNTGMFSFITVSIDEFFEYINIWKTKYIPLCIKANKIEWLSYLEGLCITLITKKDCRGL